MTESAQTIREKQSTQPQNTSNVSTSKKPTSLKILQWVYFSLGLTLLVWSTASFIVPSEGLIISGDASLVIAFYALLHLYLFYFLVTYKPILLKLAFVINFLVALIYVGFLLLSIGILLTYKTPEPVECLVSPCPLYIYADQRPIAIYVIKVLTPLLIFNFVSNAIIWRSLRNSKV